MTIHQNSIRLLDTFFNMEYEKYFATTTDYIALQKQSKIDHCKNRILMFISNKDNSRHFIQDEESTKCVVINNYTSLNEHTSSFIITVSKSSETYEIKESITYEQPIIKTITNFDPSKL